MHKSQLTGIPQDDFEAAISQVLSSTICFKASFGSEQTHAIYNNTLNCSLYVKLLNINTFMTTNQHSHT